MLSGIIFQKTKIPLPKWFTTIALAAQNNYLIGCLVDDIKERVRDTHLSEGMIAGLSLLVRGIGIMNIILASINERILEIGDL
ncbi:MAG: hypothetical protein M2R45_02758 [Verrucomicrobia subdivision 3 bacterium]|nr:hypothetical protein [Limisphaerales bacterium]MCS1414307.1 hypothetical protein [Limisphaerales bacterium]